jgi:hypothetical protein
MSLTREQCLRRCRMPPASRTRPHRQRRCQRFRRSSHRRLARLVIAIVVFVAVLALSMILILCEKTVNQHAMPRPTTPGIRFFFFFFFFFFAPFSTQHLTRDCTWYRSHSRTKVAAATAATQWCAAAGRCRPRRSAPTRRSSRATCSPTAPRSARSASNRARSFAYVCLFVCFAFLLSFRRVINAMVRFVLVWVLSLADGDRHFAARGCAATSRSVCRRMSPSLTNRLSFVCIHAVAPLSLVFVCGMCVVVRRRSDGVGGGDRERHRCAIAPPPSPHRIVMPEIFFVAIPVSAQHI